MGNSTVIIQIISEPSKINNSFLNRNLYIAMCRFHSRIECVNYYYLPGEQLLDRDMRLLIFTGIGCDMRVDKLGSDQ